MFVIIWQMFKFCNLPEVIDFICLSIFSHRLLEHRDFLSFKNEFYQVWCSAAQIEPGHTSMPKHEVGVAV